MGYIVFSCPICKADLQVDDRLKGGLARCYQCDSTVMVPMSGVHEGMVLGHYTVDSMLGEGGMGQVWLAKEQETDQEVAIKILSPALTASPESVAKFMREIELSSKLNHPRLVTVQNAGAENGVYYYVTDFIDGETLKEKLDRETIIYEKEALNVAHNIAEALKYAWEKNKLIHSDVSPSNIMLDENGSVRILDLGIARTAEKDKNLTQTGMIVGSPHYMSPEQAIEDTDIDFRADIYALGATLYHLVTGRVPFDGKNAISIITKHVNEALPQPQSQNPNISDGCNALINQMMAKKKDLRPSSWEEVLNSIDIVLAGKVPQVKLTNTKSSRFDNTSFQKINLNQLRGVKVEAPKAEISHQPRPEKEKMDNRKKQKAANRSAGKKGVRKTQLSLNKTSIKSSARSDKKSTAKRARMAKVKAKKKDPTWLIVGIALGCFAFFIIGLVVYNMHKNKQESAKREAILKQKLREAEQKAKQTAKKKDDTPVTQSAPKSKRPAQKASSKKRSKPKTDSALLKKWATANKERVQTEQPKVKGELEKISLLLEKSKELSGNEIVVSPKGDEGTIKPEDISYEFSDGNLLRFSPGKYGSRIEIPIMNNSVIVGDSQALLNDLKLFGSDERIVIKNLKCKRVTINGNAIFHNCTIQNVDQVTGTAIFSKCLVSSYQPMSSGCKVFFSKCKFDALNYNLPKGMITCKGDAVIKIISSLLVPKKNRAIVVSSGFSGRLYLEDCYMPTSSLATIYNEDDEKENLPDWQHLIKHPQITCVNCHES